jgi:hypothetical protein
VKTVTRTAARRACLLALTIGALVFVAIQSRVAQSIPLRAHQELQLSQGDPIKVPPPEDRLLPDGWTATSTVIQILPTLRVPGLLDLPASIPLLGARLGGANPLRAPPASP